MKHLMVGASVGVLATVLASGAALAQNAGGDMIEELVVTAQKRSENVQDVPKTVEVMSQETLARANVSRLADLSKLSPSLEASDRTTRGSASITMRGVSSLQVSYGLVNKVGIVLDDVPLHSNASISSEIGDIERVEILPGPQSTLNGRNSTAGLINLVTRGPTDVFTGNLAVTHTSDQETRINLFLAGPLTDTLAASLSGYTTHFRGLQKNVGTDNYAGREVRGLRGKLRWRPTDKATVLFSAYWQDARNDFVGPAYTYIAPGSFNGADLRRLIPYERLFPGVAINNDNVDFYNPRDFVSKMQEWGGTLRIDYELEQVTLTSLTSFYRLNNPSQISARHVFDLTQFQGDPLIPDGLSNLKDAINQDTQEFRITSNGEGRLSYLGGFIYDKSSHRFDTDRRISAWPNDDKDNGAKSVALYGTATYELVDNLKLTGGLRHQWNEISYYWTFLPVPIRPVDPPPKGQSSKNQYWSGDISLKYDVTPDIMVFAGASQADQGEVWDLEQRAQARAGIDIVPLESERARGYETGFKAQLFDRRLILNATAFLTNFSNYQIRSSQLATNPADPPTLKILSLGKVQTKGIEVNGVASPNDRFQMSFGAAYTDAKVKDFPNSSCYPGQPYDLTPPYEPTLCNPGPNGRRDSWAGDDVIASLAGGRMPYASKWRANLTGTYDWELSSFNLQARAAYRYRSAYITDVKQDPLSAQPALGVLDLSVRAETSDRRHAIELFVNNVTDTDTREKVVNVGLAGNDNRGAPAITKRVPRDYTRYYGVRLTTEF